MNEYYFYEVDKVLVSVPKKVNDNFKLLSEDEGFDELESIYKFGRKIDIQKIDYNKIIKIDLPFTIQDGDIYKLKDDLVYILYDFDKKEFIVRDYLTDEKFCSLKQLNKRRKSKFGNLYGSEYSLRAGLFYDSIINILHENYIETSIKIILNMPRIHLFDSESWHYFRIKLIKRLYSITLQSDYMRMMIYDFMTDSFEHFLENDINSEHMHDERKIAILESFCK